MESLSSIGAIHTAYVGQAIDSMLVTWQAEELHELARTIAALNLAQRDRATSPNTK